MQATHTRTRVRRGLPLAAGLAWFTALSAFLLVFCAPAARAEGTVTVSHGYSTFGDLKYPADYAHLDYVNPDAPKGGEISIWTMGTFDSFNPYTRKGNAAALSSVFYESLLAGTADEIGAAYGLLAHSVEYPDDKAWVIFHMRPEARFSDGTPVTAEDVVFTFELFRDEGLVSYRAVLERQVASAEALDAHTVKFTFKPEAPKRDVILSVGGLPIM